MFLPGRGDRAEVYQRERFATPLGEHGVVAEAVAVDLHVGYYVARTTHLRLHEDVIAPARARGVRQVWLVASRWEAPEPWSTTATSRVR